MSGSWPGGPSPRSDEGIGSEKPPHQRREQEIEERVGRASRRMARREAAEQRRLMLAVVVLAVAVLGLAFWLLARPSPEAAPTPAPEAAPTGSGDARIPPSP